MPGPSPVYKPLLTVEQVVQAARIARQLQAPHAHVQRARLALLLHQQPGLDHIALGTALGQHPNWVRKWRKRWVTEGFSLADKKRSGRQPLFSPSGTQYRQSHRL